MKSSALKSCNTEKGASKERNPKNLSKGGVRNASQQLLARATIAQRDANDAKDAYEESMKT